VVTTTLYLIRHGIAAERGTYLDDDERPLTEEGHRKTRKIAKQLYELNLRFELILTSPLVRAQQTAEILQTERLSSHREVNPELAPGGRCDRWLQWLETWQQSQSQNGSLALVGHEPDLSQWAEQLIGTRAPGRLILKKAGIIGLKLPQAKQALANSELFWLTAPKFFLL
jgi:phosphohistidine phosphatase